MRVTPLLLVAALSVLLGSGIAAAEKVRTNQATKVYARPGEQSKVLMTVKSGQNMKLVNKDGRWLKVRVQGRTGYVPRSKVDMADDGDIVRNTRRRAFVDGRSKRRGFGGSAPDDRVGADALGDGGGDEESDDEEEEDPAPKKPTKPTKPTKPATKGGDDEGEEEDEEEDKPAPKKPVAKPAAKGGDDDEEEEGDDEGDDEEEAAPKKTAALEDDEEENDEEESRQTARVSKKVMLYAEPDSGSDEEFVVRPDDVLYPIETKGGWTFVENAEGDGGWLQNDMLESEEGGPGGGGRRSIDIRARMGISYLQQGMRTAGSTVLEPPDNYNVGTPAIQLSIGAGLIKPQGKKLLIGGEFTYDYARALGGVTYDPDKTDAVPGKTIGITLHNINVRAMVGVDLKKKSGMALFGRLGYRYQGFLIPNGTNLTENPAKIPSEVVKGPTIGGALSLPRLTNKIGVRFSLDAMLFAASVKQTVGIEDGLNPSVKGITLGAGLNYRFKKSLDLMAAYDLNYMGVDFGMPPANMRGHMGTNVSRTDIFHMVSFGVAKPF